MEIVGLTNFVQDDINKLTAKFVGVEPHPLAEILKPSFEEYFLKIRPDIVFDSSTFLFYRTHCQRCDECLSEDEIRGNYWEHYGQYNIHFKFCSFCFEDWWFCPQCRTALTFEEMEDTDKRPLLCYECGEEESDDN